MKLLATSSLILLSKLASSTTTNGYSSKCTDDGFVEITIPYTNANTAQLLSAVAPNCDVRGESSAKHEYRYDSEAQQAVLKLNIDGCGLGSIYHESVLRSGDYYMAAANVTIGVRDETNERDLIFYNAFLGAECGTKTDYTVKFDYAQRIQKHEQDGCDENTPEGECIVAAYETYDFIFKEYTSSEFAEQVEGDAVHQANKMVYLQLEAVNLPADKKFAVKKCDFVDTVINFHIDPSQTTITTERYPMFNAASGSCSNQFIDLALGYDFDGSREGQNQMAAQISHRLFLLTRGDQDSYDLECDIKVCDKNDHDSDCNSWTACLEGQNNHENYVCEAACESDEECTESDGNAVCTATSTGPSYPQEVLDALTYYTIDRSSKQVSVTLVWREDCKLFLSLEDPSGTGIFAFINDGINSYGIDSAFAYDDGSYVYIDGEHRIEDAGHDFAIDNIGLETADSGDYKVIVESSCSMQVDAQLYIEINGVLSVHEISVLARETGQFASVSVGTDLRSGNSVRLQNIILDRANVDETETRQAQRQRRRQQNNQ